MIGFTHLCASSCCSESIERLGQRVRLLQLGRVHCGAIPQQAGKSGVLATTHAGNFLEQIRSQCQFEEWVSIVCHSVLQRTATVGAKGERHEGLAGRSCPLSYARDHAEHVQFDHLNAMTCARERTKASISNLLPNSQDGIAGVRLGKF